MISTEPHGARRIGPRTHSAHLGPQWAWLLCAWMLSMACSPHKARAEPEVPARVQLVVATCESMLPREKFIAHAQVELLSSGVQSVEIVLPEQGAHGDSSARLATIQVYYPECDEMSGVINLRVSDRLTEKYVERSLFVGDVSRDARARTVAVAAGELLRASFLELLFSNDASSEGSWNAARRRMVSHLREVEPAADATTGAIRRSASAPLSDEHEVASHWPMLRVEWIAGGRSFPEGGSGDVSSAINLSSPLGRRLRLHFGGIAAGGGAHADRNVRIFEGAGRIGLGVTGGNEIEIEVASVAELGWAKVSDSGGPDRSAFMSICSLSAVLRTRVGHGISVILGVQSGYVLTPLIASSKQGPNDARSGFLGPMVGMVLGLSGTL